MKPKKKSTWLKNRGYLHFTNQIQVGKQRGEILGKVKSEKFVAQHTFFPLIHANIEVRRFKKYNDAGDRAHSHWGKPHKKLRPLHYATHIDSMIFGYYAEKLQRIYLKELEKTPHLSKCVTAYRKIKDPEKKGKHKSTIHFAHEVFEEIKRRADNGCWVLKFDIDSFFSSMDHKVLKNAWVNLLGELSLPKHHYNVFKATTRFSFVYKDDLRMTLNPNGRRSGFNERQLAENRKEHVNAFFKDPTHFRKEIAAKKIHVYKNRFRNDNDEMVGIPQGLPISATLANIYLLEFDKEILNSVAIKINGYYRRYSDDIIVICDESHKQYVLDFVYQKLKDSKVQSNPSKTEEYYFKVEKKEDGTDEIKSYLSQKGYLLPNRPLTYLGFEFYGNKTLIKSANLSKFYRRMIFAVKSRCRMAALLNIKNPCMPTALFTRRLYKLYTNINLDKKQQSKIYKTFAPNRFGYFVYQTRRELDEFRSNYFSYGYRASKIMDEPNIARQTRRHRVIFEQAKKKYTAFYSQRLKGNS